MRHKAIWFLSCLFVLGMTSLVWADDPTSTFVSLQPLSSTLPASSTANAVQFEIWDSATAGTMIFSEAHSVDTDDFSTITNDTGFGDLLLGRCIPQPCNGGVDPTNFPAGSSRYLDVTVDGVSQLSARIPLYATPFSLNPGPQGPPGPTGPPGPPGPQGPPGVVQTVTNADTSISVTGTPQDRAVAVANGGITNTHISDGALSPAKITGTAATLGPNMFTGDQNVTGNLTVSGIAGGTIAARTQYNIGGARVLSIRGTGNGNTWVGIDTGVYIINGANNTAIGNGALLRISAGSSNTATGRDALSSNTTGMSNTATGVEALRNNTIGWYNTAIGIGALQNNCSSCSVTPQGWRNTAVGSDALFSNDMGIGNTAIGFGADVSAGNLTNATAIGYSALVNASNKIRLGNSDVTVIEGQVAYTFTSDKNQKENFQPLNAEDVLTKLAQFPISTWNYIGQDAKQFRHYGPVAQDFFAAFGHDSVGTIGTDTTINSGDMEGILMIAVQALEKRTSELATLKAENADLKARLERLERSIATLRVKAE